jgi:hypothetical protein
METGLAVLMIVVGLAVGIVIGLFIASVRTRKTKTQGIIHADYSDPEDGPYLFLEPSVPITDIVSHKRVVFDVDVTQYVSHE